MDSNGNADSFSVIAAMAVLIFLAVFSTGMAIYTSKQWPVPAAPSHRSV